MICTQKIYFAPYNATPTILPPSMQPRKSGFKKNTIYILFGDIFGSDKSPLNIILKKCIFKKYVF